MTFSQLESYPDSLVGPGVELLCSISIPASVGAGRGVGRRTPGCLLRETLPHVFSLLLLVSSVGVNSA